MEKLAIMEEHGPKPIRKYLLKSNIDYQQRKLTGFNKLLSRVKKGEKPKYAFVRVGTSGEILSGEQLSKSYLNSRISELQRGIKIRRKTLKKVV